MIEVSSVVKHYGKQKALNEVSFSIQTGEIVGFLGPNGAGKSTMMKILTGYVQPDSGSVLVAEVPVLGNTIKSRFKVGYLPENNPLYPEMYIREYLTFVAGFYPIENVKERIEELISLTGLSPESHKKIGALSKGYRQRVGLAQALLPDPEVLILDEPTTGLDPNQIVDVRDLIIRLGKEKTVLLSTHIMQEVQSICDRAIIINKGQIVADSPIAELSKSSKKGFIIKVEFDGPADASLIESLDGVTAVTEEGHAYTITALSDIRKELSVLASGQQWLILSMTTVKDTIEDVFRELTNP